MRNGQKSQPLSNHSLTPPPPDVPLVLTPEELTFLKKKEATSKISLHHDPFLNTNKYNHEASTSSVPPEPTQAPPQGFVYMYQLLETLNIPKPLTPN
jgi:hypothetical protein